MAFKKSQLQDFKQRLLDMRQGLTQHLQDASKDVKSIEEGKGYSQHQADEGTDDFDRMVNLQLTDTELEQLRQIDRALEKIEEDSYGICDLTQEPIPLARLEALPYATTTKEAQEKWEKGVLP